MLELWYEIVLLYEKLKIYITPEILTLIILFIMLIRSNIINFILRTARKDCWSAKRKDEKISVQLFKKLYDNTRYIINIIYMDKR